MEKKYGVMVNSHGVQWHEGRTLDELVCMCDWADTEEESVEDFVGDLAVIPKVIRDLVAEIRSLRTELDQVGAQSV